MILNEGEIKAAIITMLYEKMLVAPEYKPFSVCYEDIVFYMDDDKKLTATIHLQEK